MTKIYLPTELVFDGRTYFEGVQNVPQELADYITNHPQLSKIKQPKSLDKFAHLKRQSLAYLKGQLADFEADIAARNSQIQTYVVMNTLPPEKLLKTQERIMADYQELKAYVEPLLKVKEADETVRRANIEANSKARGAYIIWDKDGNYSETYLRETFVLGGVK